MALQVYRWIILKQDTLALRRQLHPALILCVASPPLLFVGAMLGMGKSCMHTPCILLPPPFITLPSFFSVVM